ncbi:MAG: metallophosphoesterase [Hyphomonadaceae bacterium]|nr:metallophosphoesterase [Hyphomonadaceae bacterium]
MKIVHISDVHVGDSPWSRLEAAARAINALEPNVVVLSGDLTQSGASQEYAEAARFLALIESPIVGTPGNHDAPVRNVFARVLAPFERFAMLGLSTTWRSADPPVEITTVNTARPFQARPDWSQGVYPKGAFEPFLDDPAAGAWRIVAAHHPPISMGGAHVRSDSRRGVQSWDTLGRASRTLLLCGHLHGFSITRVPPTRRARMIVAPTMSSGRARSAGHGFVEIDVEPEGLDVTLHLMEAEAYVPALSVFCGPS